MKRSLKQGKIQITFEFDYIGTDEEFEKIKNSQIIEDNIALGLQNAMERYPNLNINDEFTTVIMRRASHAEDYQT